MSSECFKIICQEYPSEFILDKTVAKDYFRQFGKVKKLVFKPKLRACTVEYFQKEDYLTALNNAGEYKGLNFKVAAEMSPEAKKKRVVPRIEPIWIDKDEIQAELAAMSGNAPKIYNMTGEMTDSFQETTKQEKSSKLKRAWKSGLSKNKKKLQEHFSSAISNEKMDLVNMILSQGISVEEKYRILDARDKLLRVKLKGTGHLKSTATVGTCPDMCPEKERLMRETQHQVALYEQEENGRGMDQRKAVKQYSRSSADQEAPLPHELRPVSILQMTMSYLMNDLMDLCDKSDVNIGEWFHFLWDRTRGIRKDITQQELCCQGTVELVEQCARFHIHCSARLVAEDPSVFDQKINTENLTKCLQTLKYMYHDLELKGETCPNEAEFRAYIVLLNLNDGNFMWEVQELRQEIQKSNEVKFALQVYSALDKNNYVGFFKLVYSTTYLNACILMRYFVQVRVTAIKTLLKCYLPRASKTTYPLNKLENILAFEDVESTIEFLQTYGLSTNQENTHVILEKNTFITPDFPYVLDRSLKIVESKRKESVGRIVCGRKLPSKTFENHMPQNSFDEKGYLICKDILDELELEQTRQKILFELKESQKSNENKNNTLDKEKNTSNLLSQKEVPQTSTFSNIFVKRNISSGEDVSIFGKQFSPAKGNPNIFGATQEESVPSRDQTDFGLDTEMNISTAIYTHKNIWEGSAKNIFSQPTSIFASKVSEDKTFQSVPKTGGFTFNLLPPLHQEVSNFNDAPPLPSDMILDQENNPESLAESSKLETLSAAPSESLLKENNDIVEHFDEELQEEREEEKRIIENRKILEELRQAEELRILEEKKREEDELREMKRKWQEDELRKRMTELQEEEKMTRELEITRSVKNILHSIVTQVDNNLREEKIAEISDRAKNRLRLQILKNWKMVVLTNKRKRKAMDCSPVWVNTKTLKQSAEELHTSSQDLTLQFMKRYKYGKPLDVGLLIDERINKLDLFHLTYSTLKKRFYDLTGVLQRDIFWKVAISLPDEQELPNGLNRVEDTLKELFEWKEQNGHTALVEHVECSNGASITYCIEKQNGALVEKYDANGIIFVAKDFNSSLQRRIFEHLKGFGVFTKVPIVIILQNNDNHEKCNLNTLIEEKILSDFVILSGSLKVPHLINIIEQGLVFLASKIERQPPLELDTLYSFVEKYLCTEIWKRANSFSKWNSHYRTCLQNPNVVLSLYNEGLFKLKKIVLNKSCKEFAAFPDVFVDYLRSEFPDCLPCNYKYFPKFWRDNSYLNELEKILESLSLPKWHEQWPCSNEFELESNVFKYCTKVFKEPLRPFYKIMSILLKNIDPNFNFEDVAQVLWTDVIGLLGLEKLRELNLSLSSSKFEDKSIFNHFVVVYDIESLANYNTSDWFYINNPTIKKSLKLQLNKKKDDIHCDMPDEDPNEDIQKIISKGEKQLASCKNNNSDMLQGLADFNALLQDLEMSMKIHKKISSKLEQNLRLAIEDN